MPSLLGSVQLLRRCRELPRPATVSLSPTPCRTLQPFRHPPFVVCALVNKLHGAGFEVADFTDTGTTLAGLDQMAMRDRIAVARTKLAQCVGIPESSIVGFR